MPNKIKTQRGPRGFLIGQFDDFYSVRCSIQESSIANDDCIWLGTSEANPRIMARDAKKLGLDHLIQGVKRSDVSGQLVGWVDYPIPAEVLINTRMHLNREQVERLLPLLQRFVETGQLGEEEDEKD